MKKILIIEDDPVVGHIYRSRLEKEGYAVEVAKDGQSGFYAVHQMQPNGVLLDLMLPKMNGIEILKKIRAQSQFKSLPIIVFTNAYVATMIQEAISAGATLVFNKSTLTPRQITDALNEHVSPGTAASMGLDPRTMGMGERPSIPATSAATAAASISPAVAGGQACVSLGVMGEGDSADQQEELARTFFSQVGDHLTIMRRQFQEVGKAQSEAARQGPLADVYRQTHSIVSKSGIAGLHTISQMASALEALLKEIIDKPKTATPSTLRTVANAVDFLNDLCVQEVKPNLAENPPISILVVDDDLLCRRAIMFALEKVFPKPETAANPESALVLASQKRFDVIFMDVLMPGMDGFALCEKVRASVANKTTPVVFVTTQADFNTRVQSTLSGGNDLIAKPFLFIEVALKALTFALRGRLQKMK